MYGGDCYDSGTTRGLRISCDVSPACDVTAFGAPEGLDTMRLHVNDVAVLSASEACREGVLVGGSGSSRSCMHDTSQDVSGPLEYKGACEGDCSLHVEPG